jgi:hypothetical protein
VNRHAPFLIMIGDVWFSSRPGTTRHMADGGEQGARSKGQGARGKGRKEGRSQKWEIRGQRSATIYESRVNVLSNYRHISLVNTPKPHEHGGISQAYADPAKVCGTAGAAKR